MLLEAELQGRLVTHTYIAAACPVARYHTVLGQTHHAHSLTQMPAEFNCACSLRIHLTYAEGKITQQGSGNLSGTGNDDSHMNSPSAMLLPNCS